MGFSNRDRELSLISKGKLAIKIHFTFQHQCDHYFQSCLCVYTDPMKTVTWWPQSNTLEVALQKKKSWFLSFHSSPACLLAGSQSCYWKNNVLGEKLSFIALWTLPTQLRPCLPTRHTAYCWWPAHPSSFLARRKAFCALSENHASLFRCLGWLPHFTGCILPSAAGRYLIQCWMYPANPWTALEACAGTLAKKDK